MNAEIILIGPVSAGKSTQGKLLAESLGLPRCSMDDVRWAYYQEMGYDEEHAKQLREKEGFLGLYRYVSSCECVGSRRRGTACDRE